ncbi:hypothetical protein PRIPAC_89580, partial [Pristionchus pacificus]
IYTHRSGLDCTYQATRGDNEITEKLPMEREGEPDAYIEADDGRKTPCSLREAQCWLYQGYFASSTRIALRGKDGRMCLWRTLEELVKRNGRAMPFCEWMSNEEEEELTSLHEEIIEQNRQKESLKRAIDEIRERYRSRREYGCHPWHFPSVIRLREGRIKANRDEIRELVFI